MFWRLFKILVTVAVLLPVVIVVWKAGLSIGTVVVTAVCLLMAAMLWFYDKPLFQKIFIAAIFLMCIYLTYRIAAGIEVFPKRCSSGRGALFCGLANFLYKRGGPIAAALPMFQGSVFMLYISWKMFKKKI